MKPVRGLFLAKEQTPLKTVPMEAEVGIPLNQPMEIVCKELLGLLMKLLRP
jgi:hypothetical protein